MRELDAVAALLGLAPTDFERWGPGVAKLNPEVALESRPADGRLVLVSAITPTRAGEGKTTCAIGLTDGARRLGVGAACALRQPSLGPIFGLKGGGTGGGLARLEPSDRINLHLTGDLHAVESAENLLAALADNELHFGARLDARRVLVRRCLDVDDRALRRTVIGLGDVAREERFDIAAASETMAILSLARDYRDLKRRLGEVLVGFDAGGAPLRASDLPAHGAMAAILRDALLPNLVQTTGGAPALVHGGPFANVAHGASSVLATRWLLGRAEVVFTEGGFGFDLGGEKFLHLVCRSAGFWPRTIVLVATLRALAEHGRGDPIAGLENLDAHVEAARRFGFEPIVALNLHDGDAPAAVASVRDAIARRGLVCAPIDAFARGGEGAVELARLVLARAEQRSTPKFLYEPNDPPEHKLACIAREVYGAREVTWTAEARKALDRAIELGFGALPICVAKTHRSLSDDEARPGRPRDFTLTVRELRVSAGAGFLVALTGGVSTMPGLPRRPHAALIDLDERGRVSGVE